MEKLIFSLVCVCVRKEKESGVERFIERDSA